jgi:hypothetical protein
MRLELHHLRKLLSGALVAYTRAIAYFASFMGWPLDELEAYRDRVDKVLRVAEATLRSAPSS